MESIRCDGCNRLLAKGTAVELEIKCPRCGAMTILRAAPSPSHPNARERPIRRIAVGKAKQTSVDPLPGLAPWAGGKRHLASRLADRMEAIPHRCYAEPFVGMGGVFFRRRRRPPVEVVNDRFGDVANLFRIVKHYPAAFIEEVRLQPFSRREFDHLLAIEPDALTDVQRAARFYFL